MLDINIFSFKPFKFVLYETVELFLHCSKLWTMAFCNCKITLGGRILDMMSCASFCYILFSFYFLLLSGFLIYFQKDNKNKYGCIKVHM